MFTSKIGDRWVNALAFLPDSKSIIVDSQKSLKLLNITVTRKPIAFSGHKGSVSALAVSQNGTLVVSGSSDQTAIVWDINSGLKISTLRGHAGEIFQVMISRDFGQVITASFDNTVKIWDIASAVELQFIERHKGWVLALGALSDDIVIVGGSFDYIVKAFNAFSGKEICTLENRRGPFQAVVVLQLTHYKSASSLVHYASSTTVGKSSLYETAALRSKQAANSLRKGQLNNFLLFAKKKSNNTIPHDFNHPQNVANMYGQWGYPGGHGNQWL
ncbi:hypothetical protein HK096_001108, partial [Nowakowskiella sp. JEL0078]